MQERESQLSPRAEHALAPEFWSNLLETAKDIRHAVDEVLDDPDDKFSADEPSLKFSVQRPASVSNPISSKLGRKDTTSLIFQSLYQDPLPAQADVMRSRLFSIYQDRFDALFKVLHWPLAKQIGEDHVESSASRALEAAVCFAAVCTLRAHEVEDRGALLQQTHQTVERSMNEAGLLTTTNIVTLKAFVIYLVCTGSYCYGCNTPRVILC